VVNEEDKNRANIEKLMFKLSKTAATGISWEEALQIMMFKAHMHAKALLYY
jgi:hypothetical protein